MSESGPANRPGMAGGPGRPAGWAASRDGSGDGAPSAGLAPEELAVVVAGLRQVARRLESFRGRLDELERAVQSRSGSTSRSTRESRSPTRSRSS